MKTIESINQEIETLCDEIKDAADSDHPATRKRNKLTQLRQFKMFLETNPTEEGLKIQLNGFAAFLRKLENFYSERLSISEIPLTDQFKKDFRKRIFNENGAKEIKRKIKTLKYLLK